MKHTTYPPPKFPLIIRDLLWDGMRATVGDTQVHHDLRVVTGKLQNLQHFQLIFRVQSVATLHLRQRCATHQHPTKT